eukprot:scaffold1.g5365.t1
MASFPRMPVRMTVVGWREDGPDGAAAPAAPGDEPTGSAGATSLVLISPFPPLPGLVKALRRLGTVRFLLAPNSVHCLWGRAARDAAFPDALLLGPPAAARRHPGVPFDALIRGEGDLPAGWPRANLRVFPTAPAAPFLSELVFVHRPSASLIVTDMAFNYKHGGETPLPAFPFTLYLSATGGYRICCASKPFAWICKDADRMCAVLKDVLAEPFDQVRRLHVP